MMWGGGGVKGMEEARWRMFTPKRVFILSISFEMVSFLSSGVIKRWVWAWSSGTSSVRITPMRL